MKFCPRCGLHARNDAQHCRDCNAWIGDEPIKKYEPGKVERQPEFIVVEHDDEPVDEKFLSTFSWGAFFRWYYFSKAMYPWLIADIAFFALLKWNTYTTEQADRLVGGVSDVGLVRFFVVLVVGLNLWLATMVWAGIVARRRRWKILNWNSFTKFRENEKWWGVAGIFGFMVKVGTVCTVCYGVLKGIMLYY